MPVKNNITTIFADTAFYSDFNKILKLPANNYGNYWQGHYVSFEVKDPNSQNPILIQRVYTKQEADFRIPHARDNLHNITPTHYQCVTASHVYEIPCRPQELTQIQNLIQRYQAKTISARPDYAQEIFNITTVQQSSAYSEIKIARPMKEILKHETMLDNKVNSAQPHIVNNTAVLFNKKYPTPERFDLEKEIDTYVKNGAKLAPKDTINFYESSIPIINNAIKNPLIKSSRHIVDYKGISAETQRLAQKLRGVFTFK